MRYLIPKDGVWYTKEIPGSVLVDANSVDDTWEKLSSFEAGARLAAIERVTYGKAASFDSEKEMVSAITGRVG